MVKLAICETFSTSLGVNQVELEVVPALLLRLELVVEALGPIWHCTVAVFLLHRRLITHILRRVFLFDWCLLN